jgi:hypothetical protein
MVRISLVSKEAWGVGVGVEKHFFSEHFYYRVGIVSQFILGNSVRCLSPRALTSQANICPRCTASFRLRELPTTATMSWRCNASKTRSATLAAEEDAAAAGTQMDNESLVKLLMGEFTDDEDNDPTPTTAEPVAAEWPDEKHIKSAIFAVENPYLVVPHPKNANHPMCEGCGDFAANTLVVPDPGTVPKWPA